MLVLTQSQTEAVNCDDSCFYFGPAGTGKSTTLLNRLLKLLRSGEQAYTILLLVSDPAHRLRFSQATGDPALGPRSELKIITYNYLAREMIDLFWPLIARSAGFRDAHSPATFLSYDLAQLLMWKILKPLMNEGMFVNLRLRPQQIVSQILDTLNRAAFNGITLDEAYDRQITSWSGERDHIRHLKDAAAVAGMFRKHCLDNNLLDLSLIIQVFNSHLLHQEELNRYFEERYRHLLVDNVEEQSISGLNFIAFLLERSETSAIVYDLGGGYKRFLGADPEAALGLRPLCRQTFEFEQSFTASTSLVNLSGEIANFLTHSRNGPVGDSTAILETVSGRFRREMVVSTVEYISRQVALGLKPDEIAIITPYLDGALRYSLESQIKQESLPYRFTRRLYSPREEPRIRAWITWLSLANPEWNLRPSPFDVAEALDLSIAVLDPARAEMVVGNLYHQDKGLLEPVDHLAEALQERIGHGRLQLVEELRLWLDENGHQRYDIDHFLFRLFNDLLAQTRFQPEHDLAGAAICDWLVRIASKIRLSARRLGLDEAAELASFYVDAIYQGLVSARPPDLGNPPDPEGIMISTMYGFLLSDRPVRQQIWLDVSASGWWDIPRQPLSNAFVFSQSWDNDRKWTMEDDFAIRNQLLSGIVKGLIRRCREGIVLAVSDLDRRGFRQDNPLWRSLQPILRRQKSAPL